MDKNQILMMHGTDYVDMAVRLLTAADLAGLIGNREKRIALKPNLVVARSASDGAVTHPELVEGVIRYLRDNGFQNLSVIEGSWVGARTDQAMKASGIGDVCRRYEVPFHDLQRDSTHIRKASNEMEFQVCDRLNEVDFLINMPVLKGHCQTTVTCALKNMKGVISNGEKRRFHTLGLHEPIAYLNTVVKQDFILVDNICGDLDFEEGGNPVTMNRIFACLDPVLCDAFVSETMGYDPKDIRYLALAGQLGVGSIDIAKAERVLLNPDASAGKKVRATRRVESLAQYADAADACSACYGSLIYALDRLDEEGLARGKKTKIRIGQGWKDKSGEIGVGICTNGCARSLNGCPPSAAEMVSFLRENWE